MAYQLPNWEDSFEQDLATIDVSKRAKPGALLRIIPDRERWLEFLSAVSSEWNVWKRDPDKYPACLVVLYGGLAFFEYDENTFWPHFAKVVGSISIPPNQQAELNNSFIRASESFGLRALGKTSRRTPHSYIGLAVSQIGIPLSLWDGFLEICNWASWQDNWDTYSDEAWELAIGKRAGSRTRLKNFLVLNRDTSTSFIKEILGARNFLATNPEWGISELSQACLLRAEYFEEVPETAEFLRPNNPESLIADRAQILWDEKKGRIVLYLPGVPPNKLPATWSLDRLMLFASRSPHEFAVNSAAFQAILNLNLESKGAIAMQRLRGVYPWGLFDLDRGGRLTNHDREYLPLHNYALLSSTPIPNIQFVGFEESDSNVNQRYELGDGTQCFLTHLWSTGNYAELTIGNGSARALIRFRTSSKIEARFFVGRGHRAANFDLIGPHRRKIDGLPVLCLAIPYGYFRDTSLALKGKFRVCLDGKSAGGKWEVVSSGPDSKDYQLFIWNWGPHPFMEVPSGKYSGFKQLAESGRSPDLKGERTFSIQSDEFTVSYQVYVEHQKPGMDECWKNLPGAFLPWFLLCQEVVGMKWEDMLIARDIIEPDSKLSAYLLRKYEKEGFLVQQGVRWRIAESRASLSIVGGGKCRLDYCGDPSLLWRFYRWMSRRDISLPNIDIVNKRGEVPYLTMMWDGRLHEEIHYRLKRMDIRVGSSLWNH